MSIETTSRITIGVVMLCWIVFAIGFLLRRKTPRVAEARRDSRAMIGLLLEAAGFALIWSLRRNSLSRLLPLAGWAETIVAVMAAAIAAASVWLALAAIFVLGKQWSPAARIVAHHQLITARPYRIVRHPIYTAMFGMLTATGLAISTWEALLLAMVVYLAGTRLRIAVEEKLLLENFGGAYAAYRGNVPALIPYLW
jgi:protein-S-isoprenylcysteine O-methyltransferase Ste14